MGIFTDSQLDFLPPRAREKAVALDDQRDAAAAAMRAATNDLEAAWARRDILERDAANAGQAIRLGTIATSSHPLDKLHARIGDPTEANVTPLLAKVEKEISERLRPKLDRAVAAFEGYAVVEATAAWLSDAMRAGVRLKDAPEQKMAGSDFQKQVARLRADIKDLEDRLDRADTAPQPLAEVRAAIVREVDEIAEHGRPTVSFTAREVGPLRLDGALGLVVTARGARVAETVVWALQDLLKERALQLVGNVEPENALTNDQRITLMEKLAADRLEAERVEEAVITAAAETGLVIPRRRDADPRAVLAIVETSPSWRSRHDIGVVEIGRR